ncbi:MAG: tetratricopeptide repeat protein [Candidatus Nitronauta litoralis]|uniref:Tetratricopeptide repeat protein n=1 Tax=Candidatus Nitronauta litoralis TaxID=2705533 RepID=A0A7T0BXJ2_9BACT|nr:MAG: tetratricopeptide repeat protein [Candidatus Nitronauta litoralis]
MSNDFSKKPTLALALMTMAALIAAFVDGPGLHENNTSATSHKHEEGSHADHQDPEAQRRMAIFHYNKGNQFLRSNQWDKAVHQYEMALGHESRLLPVYVNMSTALMRQKRFPQARQILDRLEKQAPEMPELHYNLACYFSLTGDVEKGLEALAEAVRKGYSDMQGLETDPDLKALRDHPGYSTIPKRL